MNELKSSTQTPPSFTYQYTLLKLHIYRPTDIFRLGLETETTHADGLDYNLSSGRLGMHSRVKKRRTSGSSCQSANNPPESEVETEEEVSHYEKRVRWDQVLKIAAYMCQDQTKRLSYERHRNPRASLGYAHIGRGSIH